MVLTAFAFIISHKYYMKVIMHSLGISPRNTQLDWLLFLISKGYTLDLHPLSCMPDILEVFLISSDPSTANQRTKSGQVVVMMSLWNTSCLFRCPVLTWSENSDVL